VRTISRHLCGLEVKLLPAQKKPCRALICSARMLDLDGRSANQTTVWPNSL
jgi:hypothetical protein